MDTITAKERRRSSTGRLVFIGAIAVVLPWLFPALVPPTWVLFLLFMGWLTLVLAA